VQNLPFFLLVGGFLVLLLPVFSSVFTSVSGNCPPGCLCINYPSRSLRLPRSMQAFLSLLYHNHGARFIIPVNGLWIRSLLANWLPLFFGNLRVLRLRCFFLTMTGAGHDILLCSQPYDYKFALFVFKESFYRSGGTYDCSLRTISIFSYMFLQLKMFFACLISGN
jgi:hypothetical protein